MPVILVATKTGCRVFSADGTTQVELPGQVVWAIAPDNDGSCLAIVDGNVWRRGSGDQWSMLAKIQGGLASIASINGEVFGGSMSEAAIIRLDTSHNAERLSGFDNVSGRREWLQQGPPLHIRSITSTADNYAIMAAVHVGGIPRSTDGGKTWTPTIPIMDDVHEVRAHPTMPNVIAAATAVGLRVSQDGGRTWELISDGLTLHHLLAVALLDDEVLFSAHDGEEGPFPKRSQIWRWRIGSKSVEQVRSGLPEWLVGKVDTNHIAAGKGRAAVLDGGGNLWLSGEGSSDWECIGDALHDSYGVHLLSG